MSELDSSFDRFDEVETGEAFTLQNQWLLKIELAEASVMARSGAMVAYQGDVRFEHKSGGLGRMLKKARVAASKTLPSAAKGIATARPTTRSG